MAWVLLVTHIKGSDPITDEGDAHLLECGECQALHPVAHWFAVQRFARLPHDE